MKGFLCWLVTRHRNGEADILTLQSGYILRMVHCLDCGLVWFERP